MPEPTPSQLKIDGIVTVPEGEELRYVEQEFRIFVELNDYKWNGTISPLNPDAESFMVEVERTKIKWYEDQIDKLYWIINDDKLTIEANNKAYSDLADKYSRLNKSYNMLKLAFYSEQDENESLSKEVNALKVRLKVKDSPIKAGLKRIWKWFKGLVGK